MEVQKQSRLPVSKRKSPAPIPTITTTKALAAILVTFPLLPFVSLVGQKIASLPSLHTVTRCHTFIIRDRATFRELLIFGVRHQRHCTFKKIPIDYIIYSGNIMNH